MRIRHQGDLETRNQTGFMHGKGRPWRKPTKTSIASPKGSKHEVVGGVFQAMAKLFFYHEKSSILITNAVHGNLSRMQHCQQVLETITVQSMGKCRYKTLFKRPRARGKTPPMLRPHQTGMVDKTPREKVEETER